MMLKQRMLSAFYGALLTVSATMTVANDNWKPYPSDLFKPDLTGDNLAKEWPNITRATRDALPEDPALQDVWRVHFEGNFAEAKAKGLALGTPQGKYVAYRAQTIYAMYMTPKPSAGEEESAERTVLLKEAADELRALVDDMDSGKIESSLQIRFWFAYAMGRYVEIMKPTWGILTKKSKVKEMLKYASDIPPASDIPAFHAFRGGVYAAIYDDGFLARTTFRGYIEDCEGTIVGYEDGSLKQFKCAVKALGATPFPELYNSYAKALLQLDSKKYQDEAETYKQYATGASTPPGVDNMIFSAEDAMARNAAKKQ
ncbi:hypothetical protein [Parendozoicomonas sp. Alg238-R29]|uniref:hypothetical protein n=1 Tax=Parendozoicomonas sp. Alg238-R29 TaxID=2993446 RepID=UPI00248D8F70|nr:hypothetical protein [Parendozoicomonas sp. Alg238-R29]